VQCITNLSLIFEYFFSSMKLSFKLSKMMLEIFQIFSNILWNLRNFQKWKFHVPSLFTNLAFPCPIIVLCHSQHTISLLIQLIQPLQPPFLPFPIKTLPILQFGRMAICMFLSKLIGLSALICSHKTDVKILTSSWMQFHANICFMTQ